jgi:transposase
MEQWTEIRRRVLIEGVPKRQILRETGMHWTTLEKILAHSAPPGYRLQKNRLKPKIGPYRDRIVQILEADKAGPKKQRHTVKRIYERLQSEGYTGGYTAVKDVVRKVKARSREVFVPLVHRPGEGQVDFGHALAKLGGRLRKVAFFVMALPFSDAFFLQAFERECTETFWEGHVQAFAFLGAVPWRLSYDNSRVAVSKILGGHRRKLTRGFLELKSHYLFDHHFCNVRRANEKGVVESTVKYARLNFFVPVPEVGDLKALNAYLLERCREDLDRRLRGKKDTKAALLAEEREAMLQLPESGFDACRKASTTASSLSLVRFDSNDYSVPVRYAHHPVVVKGYVDRVEIFYKGQRVARHGRVWEKEQVSFEPVHYLALLERKPGALDHARPLEGWQLPESFSILRRRLETEAGGEGTREYIRILRLLEKHPLAKLTRAVDRALSIRAHSRDAVAQFLWPREPWPMTTFRLDGREHLRHVRVDRAELSDYRCLLETGGTP